MQYCKEDRNSILPMSSVCSVKSDILEIVSLICVRTSSIECLQPDALSTLTTKQTKWTRHGKSQVVVRIRFRPTAPSHDSATLLRARQIRCSRFASHAFSNIHYLDRQRAMSGQQTSYQLASTVRLGSIFQGWSNTIKESVRQLVVLENFLQTRFENQE